MKTSYGTLSETITALREEGYTLDFNLHEDCVVCNRTQNQLMSDEFEIDAIFRFDGLTDPDDESVIYAISSEKFKTKGLLVNGYGLYSEEFPAVLIEKLRKHNS
ncbi:MAG: phosphoribosylpyrophosphate synthetase [Bacteroidetes bacterium]|jgi:hypothetical protein|nr:phosphoribosylpyrophosphate synthetase [Bacteroidota bacterium]